MKATKPQIHFVDKYLLNPTNPVIVNLIGAGGTGSRVLTSLTMMNCTLTAMGHPGLFVNLFDDDLVTSANKGRQLFTDNEIGQPKAAVLINRANRFFGTNWKAVTHKISSTSDNNHLYGNITISCVDSVKARFEIANILKKSKTQSYERNRPMYWIDFGNGKHTGQVMISTIGTIKQPSSKKYAPVAKLPFVTDEFKTLLENAKEDDSPSCSVAEALNKQDLFINPGLAALGSSILWSMFREGMLRYRGFFLNLRDLRSQPIPITSNK